MNFETVLEKIDLSLESMNLISPSDNLEPKVAYDFLVSLKIFEYEEKISSGEIKKDDLYYQFCEIDREYWFGSTFDEDENQMAKYHALVHIFGGSPIAEQQKSIIELRKNQFSNAQNEIESRCAYECKYD